ncbi:MAG: hypothetical protein ACMXYK_01245 [Candidatus Woesearchaeota archaeon]
MRLFVVAGVIMPFIMLFVLATSADLLVMTEHVTEKVDIYTGNMSVSVQCVLRGEFLEVCNPELLDFNFDTDIEEFIALQKQIVEDSEHILKQIVVE